MESNPHQLHISGVSIVNKLWITFLVTLRSTSGRTVVTGALVRITGQMTAAAKISEFLEGESTMLEICRDVFALEIKMFVKIVDEVLALLLGCTYDRNDHIWN